MDQPYRMRAVLAPLDPTPAQEQLLRSYCGASRFAYNRTVGVAKENKDKRKEERRAGIDEADLTKALSWSAWSMTPLWNSMKDEVAPWHHDISKHAFQSGVTNAALALKNYSESKKGVRKGPPMGFPKFKNRHSKQSLTFIQFDRTGNWFSEDSRHVRLILPRFATDPRITRRREQLQWIHTTESLARLTKKVMAGEWTVQSVTISLDRDVNAARNIRDEGIRLLTNEASTVAGHQPETLNAVSRDRKTKPPRRGRGDRYQSRTTQSTPELSPLA